MMVYPQILLSELLIIFISTLLRSTFGFGNALIAMPLLVLAILAVLLGERIVKKIPDKKIDLALNSFLVFTGLLMFL